MTVHNHGSEEGEGLACPEILLPSGQRKGKCLIYGDYLRGDISINNLRRAMGMSNPEVWECDPQDCQQQAKDMVMKHIRNRYDGRAEFDVYIESFIVIGKTWRAVVRTSLPNTGIFVVQFYALERKMTLRAYALVEELSSYKG